MILRSFARAASAARVLTTNPTPGGLVRSQERKRPQKGDFAGRWSFAGWLLGAGNRFGEGKPLPDLEASNSAQLSRVFFKIE